MKTLSPFCSPSVFQLARLVRRVRSLAPLVLLLLSGGSSTSALAQVPGSQGLFLQGGAGEQVQALTAGLNSAWRSRWNLAGGQLGGYWEASLSQWWPHEEHEGRAPSRISQVALTPVFRWRAQEGASPWFVEAGIGLTYMSPRYQNGGKRFSTRFNFGDHLAIGRSFGPTQRHEWLLRVQHFSNGSLREPNPGENFVQLRYAAWFD